MNLGGFTATGPREANEDNLFFFDFSNIVSFPNGVEGLAVVSDGMGGYQGGDIASKIVVDQSANYLKQLFDMATENPVDLDADAALAEIVDRAHTSILSEAEHVGKNMGATFVGAFVSESHAWVGHVGDSRAYHITNGQAIQITEDHSQVGRMLARGLITEEEAQNHPERNKIEQALGFTVSETSTCEVDLRPGDALLLCSDGVYTALGNEKLAALVSAEKDATLAAERVVKAAISAGTDDNSTAVVVFPGRQLQSRRTGTLSEADSRTAVALYPRHAKSQDTERIPRGRSSSGKFSHVSGSRGFSHQKSVNRVSAKQAPVPQATKTRIVSIAVAVVLLAVIAAIAFNALNSNQGNVAMSAGNQSTMKTSSTALSDNPSATNAASTSSVSTNNASADKQDTESSLNENTKQDESTAASILQGSKTVCYIDMNGNIREFSKENGLQSPNLILGQGKSVLTDSDIISGDDGQPYIYLNDSYTTDLLNDVRLYENGERTFNSGFAQLFDLNSYLRTIEGISAFFSTASYGIEQEVTHLVILKDSLQSTDQTNEMTDTSAAQSNSEDIAEIGPETASASAQNPQESTVQNQNSVFGGLQEGE